MSRQAFRKYPGLGPLNRGFTLVETLVTMAVLSVGLAGLAATEVLSFRKNNDSYLRAQAILQAHEMTGRMHANPAGVSAGAYNSISESIINPPDCLDEASITVEAANSTNCSASDIAAFDANEWLTSTATLLPGGAGTVFCPDIDSNGICDVDIYTITINWQETKSSTAEASSRSFSFEFKPLP